MYPRLGRAPAAVVCEQLLNAVNLSRLEGAEGGGGGGGWEGWLPQVKSQN